MEQETARILNNIMVILQNQEDRIKYIKDSVDFLSEKTLDIWREVLKREKEQKKEGKDYGKTSRVGNKER